MEEEEVEEAIIRRAVALERERCVHRAYFIYDELEERSLLTDLHECNVFYFGSSEDDREELSYIVIERISLEDNTVTVRDRDTTKQERKKQNMLINFLKDKIK